MNEGQTVKHRVQAVICIVLWTILAYHFCSRMVVRTLVVDGSSMYPTLREGEAVVVEMLTSRFHGYQRGEIVVLEDGKEGMAVKRIIGLPGEHVRISEGGVSINGHRLYETYLPRQVNTFSNRQGYRLGEDQYFVLGDNRAESFDSRFYGGLPRKAIIGRMCFAMFPGSAAR